MSTISLANSNPAAAASRSVGSRVLAGTSPEFAALALRLPLGAVMLAHAAKKFFVFTIAGTGQFFAAHGFPSWTALPVALIEAIGGLLLIVGFGTRWASLLLVPVMIGALLVHAPNGWVFTNAGGGWEYVGFLIAALVAQALLGDGALSAGRAFRRRA